MSRPNAPPPLLRPGRREAGTLTQLGRWFADDVRDSLHAIGRRLRPRRRIELPAWGEPKSQDRDFKLIAGYHEQRRNEAGAVSIDDRTWSDLHLETVYAQIDRCVSPVGEQMLYDMLRTFTDDDAVLRERDAAAMRFTESTQLRQAVQEALVPLRVGDTYFLPNLFQPGLPQRPLWFAFPVLTLLALAMIVLLFFQPIPGLIGLVAVAATNLTIQYHYHHRIQPVVRPLTVLRRLLAAAHAAGSLDDDVLRPRLQDLRERTSRMLALSGCGALRRARRRPGQRSRTRRVRLRQHAAAHRCECLCVQH